MKLLYLLFVIGLCGCRRHDVSYSAEFDDIDCQWSSAYSNVTITAVRDGKVIQIGSPAAEKAPDHMLTKVSRINTNATVGLESTDSYADAANWIGWTWNSEMDSLGYLTLTASIRFNCTNGWATNNLLLDHFLTK